MHVNSTQQYVYVCTYCLYVNSTHHYAQYGADVNTTHCYVYVCFLQCGFYAHIVPSTVYFHRVCLALCMFRDSDCCSHLLRLLTELTLILLELLIHTFHAFLYVLVKALDKLLQFIHLNQTQKIS